MDTYPVSNRGLLKTLQLPPQRDLVLAFPPQKKLRLLKLQTSFLEQQGVAQGSTLHGRWAKGVHDECVSR